ncbi:ABC-three component system middle component 2 [Streptomyces sp. NPDC001100]
MAQTDHNASREKNVFESYFRAEDEEEFRLAQLVLLLETMRKQEIHPSIERLGVLDFFAANPFLVVQPDEPDYKHLVLAGFSVKPMSYASPGHRFVTRKNRIEHDLALLVAYGLVRISVEKGYRVCVLTSRGSEISEQLTSMYADAYRTSAEVVGKRLRKVPDSKLQEASSAWLNADPAMLDLYDM